MELAIDGFDTASQAEIPIFDQRSICFGTDSAEPPDRDPDSDAQAWRIAYQSVAKCVRRDGLVTTSTGQGPIPYPVAPAVALLNPDAESVLRRRVRAVLSGLNRITRLYGDNAELREFLALPEPLAAWVDRDLQNHVRQVDLCRFDLLGSSLDDVRVLEFNANCPGGLLYTGMVDAYWRAQPEVAEIIASWDARPLAIEDRGWFAHWLLGLRGGGRADGVVLLRPDVGNQLEVAHMAAQLRGCDVIVARQDVADYRRQDATRLAYLKHSVPADADMRPWTRFCGDVVSGHLVIPSGLAGRWIGDNKLCLAVMSDPRFRYLFEQDEREAIDALVPFSRKLGQGISPAEVLANQKSLVAKKSYGTQGRNVVVGREVDPDEWERLICREAGNDWLIQQYVEANRTGPLGLNRDLSPCLVGGELWGYCSRLSRNNRVNVAQGGARQAVFVAGSAGE